MQNPTTKYLLEFRESCGGGSGSGELEQSGTHLGNRPTESTDQDSQELERSGNLQGSDLGLLHISTAE